MMSKYILAGGVFVVLICAAFFIGALLPSAYQVHYHANFAVYIAGERIDFSGNQYMEEVSRCNVSTDVQPQDRIHLHDNVGDVVHVHMAASTWWDLFSNLHWTLGRTFISDQSWRLYSRSETGALYYFLNGEEVENPANIPVRSEDRLLIWYGTGTLQEIQERFFPMVATSATAYNQKDDPASCSINARAGIFSRLRELLPHEHN